MENNYNDLLNELYKFYKEIKNYIYLYFREKEDKELLEIDFYKDFTISNNLKNRFISYDNESQKFLISIAKGISKYNKIKDTKPLNLIDVKDKMENKYYSYFTLDELSQVIKNYNVDFMQYIKSEFLYEYIKRILNLQGKNTIHYSDEYIECSENLGFVINDIIVELETRMIAKRFNLLYIPISIGNDSILKKIYLICIEKQNIIFNGNIDDLFNSLSYYRLKKLLEYEEKEFEIKYNLKKNSLSDERNSNPIDNSIEQKYQKIMSMLQRAKDNI